MFVPWTPPDGRSYSYLLGLYLGDGCIGRPAPNSYQLNLDCDGVYPDLLDEAMTAMNLTLPSSRVAGYTAANSRCIRISASSPDLPEIFPQHGPGRKHTRPIVLEPWQREILDRFPEEFLRGLVHSDGCRTINRFKTRLPSGRTAEYAYPRYFFSNLSADIRALFCEYCERLGIRWTQSNARNISVSHRDSVAKLDSFIGPKC